LDFLGEDRVECLTANFARTDAPDDKFEFLGISIGHVASEGRGHTYLHVTPLGM
jgi:hypothetical protein